jgi:hypothetical protein
MGSPEQWVCHRAAGGGSVAGVKQGETEMSQDLMHSVMEAGGQR